MKFPDTVFGEAELPRKVIPAIPPSYPLKSFEMLYIILAVIVLGRVVPLSANPQAETTVVEVFALEILRSCIVFPVRVRVPALLRIPFTAFSLTVLEFVVPFVRLATVFELIIRVPAPVLLIP
mgnify:CR=1 FL=1